jgi:homocysteine S-methyltransferase
MQSMSPEEVSFSGLRVLDGGLATELEHRGCDLSGPLWSAQVLDQSPKTIAAVHLDFLRAGADCISTSSYQVSSLGYRELGRDPGSVERALRQSVAIAEEARAQYAQENPRRTWIAASLGPFGAVLHNGEEYRGNYQIGFDELVAFHTERLRVVADTHADFIAFETVPSLEEARAILRALASCPDTTAWVSFTCRDEKHVGHGELLRDCTAAVVTSPQVLAAGINCTPPHLVRPLIAEARAGLADERPVIVYPNSGEKWNPVARTWKGSSDAAQYGELAREWFSAGAQAVGGCCRTGPAHIRAVAAAARGESRPDVVVF